MLSETLGRCVQQTTVPSHRHNLSFSPLPLPIVGLLMYQEASQRSLERCSEAEGEIETLRSRLAELEGRDSGRDAVVALETKVDELEEVIVVLLLYGPVLISVGVVVFVVFSTILIFRPWSLSFSCTGCMFITRYWSWHAFFVVLDILFFMRCMIFHLY